MTDETPNFSFKKWLMGTVVTTSLVCGGVGGVAAFFLADGFMDVGPDPAIHASEVKDVLTQQVQQVDARIATLEKRVDEMPEQATTQDNSAIEERISSLNDKVASIKTEATESKMGQIVLALTQIKAAYEQDTSMQPGVDLLKKTILDPELQSKIDALSKITYPARHTLVQEAQRILAPTATNSLATDDTSWQGRGRAFLGQFVKVQPKDQATQQSTNAQVITALQQDDLPLASNLLSKLPQNNDQVIALGQSIQQRILAQQTVQELMGHVTTALNQGKTGLY